MSQRKSSSISVFPCANRGEFEGKANFNLQSRLTSEYNLTSIINQLVDKHSFVISPSDTSTPVDTSSPISFNINGYYFKIDTIENAIGEFSNSNNLYASIQLKTTYVDGFGNMIELSATGDSDEVAGDSGLTLDDAVFTGLDISDALRSGTNIYSLHILKKDGGSWYVPPESTVRFITDNTRRSVKIDDGELS